MLELHEFIPTQNERAHIFLDMESTNNLRWCEGSFGHLVREFRSRTNSVVQKRIVRIYSGKLVYEYDTNNDIQTCKDHTIIGSTRSEQFLCTFVRSESVPNHMFPSDIPDNEETVTQLRFNVSKGIAIVAEYIQSDEHHSCIAWIEMRKDADMERLERTMRRLRNILRNGS